VADFDLIGGNPTLQVGGGGVSSGDASGGDQDGEQVAHQVSCG